MSDLNRLAWWSASIVACLVIAGCGAGKRQAYDDAVAALDVEQDKLARLQEEKAQLRDKFEAGLAELDDLKKELDDEGITKELEAKKGNADKTESDARPVPNEPPSEENKRPHKSYVERRMAEELAEMDRKISQQQVIVDRAEEKKKRMEPN